VAGWASTSRELDARFVLCRSADGDSALVAAPAPELGAVATLERESDIVGPGESLLTLSAHPLITATDRPKAATINRLHALLLFVQALAVTTFDVTSS
jgi:hypothetical protein